MSKKMTVKEFVTKYTSLNSEKIKQGLLDDISIKEYIPYERKADLCKALVKSASYDKKTDEEGKEIRTFKRDSILEYMMFNLMLVKEYTSLEVDYKNNLEEFNLLNQPTVTVQDESGNSINIGLLDVVISKISPRELKEFKMILDLTRSDLMQNEYETHAFISNQVERLTDVFKIVAKAAEPTLLELSEKIKTMDEKDIKKINDKIMKWIK